MIARNMKLYGTFLYLLNGQEQKVIGIEDPLSPFLAASQMSNPTRHWVRGRRVIGQHVASKWEGYLMFIPVEALN